MPRLSAGLMMYRATEGELEVLLVHPGGPFWAKKDLGVWTIPKGETDGPEDLLETAKREFAEETGFEIYPPFVDLGLVKQAGGKVVAAWAFAGDCNPRALKSNRCEIEWPPRSGRRIVIPEVDRADWFTLERAGQFILPAQSIFLDRLRLAQT